MTALAERLKSQLADLPVEDRTELACYLIQTLDAEIDPEAEAAWDAELARREQEIRGGQAAREPADEVFARLRAHLP
jgi:putative addiction module component (TIGR02574 family)